MNAFVLMLAAMTLVVGVILAATPWIMPQTECFAVTVPSGARDEEPLRGYLRSYTLLMAAVSALCTLAWPVGVALVPLDEPALHESTLVAVLATVTTMAPVVVGFALMLHFRRKVQAVKDVRGWHAEHARSAALVGPEEYPVPISLYWDLVYIPLVVGLVVFGITNYDRFPDMMPMNMGYDGSVVRYAPKTLATVLFPAIVATFLGIVLSASHWGIVLSKRPIDPNAPASSALAYGRFARLMSQFHVGMGAALSLLIGVTYYACALGTIPLMVGATVMLVGSLGFVVAAAVLSLRMGQAGALLREDSGNADLARDDDAYWKLGIIYANREDPSVVVPKRFGVGWTINIARPAAWAVIGGFVLLTAVFVWATMFTVS